MDFQTVVFPCQRSADQDAATPAHHPVVVVGAGPVGLSLAIDLAQRGQAVVLLDDDDRLSSGSRAICFAKRTLEIFDRLGCGAPMVSKGVSWQVGRVYFGSEQVYQFDLQPEPGHERPAFINLQQYYVEGHLVERAQQLPLLDLRWKHALKGITQSDDKVTLTVNTPEGDYAITAGHVVACDGSRSPTRGLLGLESKGVTFKDRFLIADVTMKADFPPERRFWFNPPFHPEHSVLLHRQPDSQWRIDFQLGWQADPEVERQPERIRPRVQALLGPGVQFEITWASVYTFSCLRMEKFRHGRVLFAGDSAHGVSPFGARGANSGVQDADNLGWKLHAVLQGHAPDALLSTYASERGAAADENILNSTRATDFITPKSTASRLFRDAVLSLAREHAFARSLVNSGRLSVPAVLTDSPLNTPDVDSFKGQLVPGAVAADAPVSASNGAPWLLQHLHGNGFTLLLWSDDAAHDATLNAAAQAVTPTQLLRIGQAALQDPQGLLQQRYDAQPGTAYLLRPDQHICARWREPTPAAVQAALRRALAHPANG